MVCCLKPPMIDVVSRMSSNSVFDNQYHYCCDLQSAKGVACAYHTRLWDTFRRHVQGKHETTCNQTLGCSAQGSRHAKEQQQLHYCRKIGSDGRVTQERARVLEDLPDHKQASCQPHVGPAPALAVHVTASLAPRSKRCHQSVRVRLRDRRGYSPSCNLKHTCKRRLQLWFSS